MRYKVIRRDKNSLSLLLEGIPVIVANSIRRVALTELPVMAVEYVFVYENSSIMDDQILAHRIGFIALTTNPGDYVLHDNCDCGVEYGCSKCSVTLNLEAEAKDARVVYSKEIKSDDASVVPASPDIPIVKLAPGQRVLLEMRALLGCGENHAKFQPVSQAVVRGVPIFEVDEKICDECAICVKECPIEVIALNPKPVLTDLYLCTTCKICQETCPPEAITVAIDESSSILTLESNGQIPPEKILEESLSILIGKADQLKDFFDKVSF